MAIVFDNASSSRGTAATLSFNFAIGGGSNRLLVIGISVVGGEVGIVHFNSHPAHFVGVQVDGTLRTYLYYWFDINLPSVAGTYLLEVFGSAGLTSIEAAAVAVSGAQQGAPEATGQSSVTNNTSISTAVTPLTPGAMGFDVVGILAGTITTFTPGAGQTKRDQQDGPASDLAVSTRPFSAAGASSVGWTFNAKANRAGHIVAIWAPAAGGGGQPGLRDIRTAVTTIVTPGSGGNFAVAGIGFKGKAAFFWGVPVQGTAVAIDAAQWLGIADDATPTIRQKCTMVSSRGGVAHNRCAADRQNAISILRADSDTPAVVGNIVSWNADGLVINFTTTTPGYVIFAMVLGGADLRSFVGEATIGSGNGSVTGVPFSPDLGLAISHDAALSAAPSTAAKQSLGVFDRNLNQWWMGAFQGVEDTAKKNSLLKTTGFVGQIFRGGNPLAPQVSWEARVTAVTADGFTWNGADADGFFFLLLNLGGARAQVGTFAKSIAAAPVVQKLPDPGWKAQAYLLASAVKNNQDPTANVGCRVAIGAIAGSRQRSTLRTDLDASTNADQRANDQRVLGLGNTDADYTAVARALPIVDNMPAFEWSPNDNQARLIGYLLIEQGITNPVMFETPVRLVSAGSLKPGTPTQRATDESVVLEIRDALNPTGYRIEHLVDPAQGKAGGWRLYYQFAEGIILGTGTVIEVHSSSADGDPEPRPGRIHRYTTASGQPASFVLNAPNDLVRLVRPDGVEAEEVPVVIAPDAGAGDHVVRGEVQNKAGALVPGVLVQALQLTWTTLGLQESSLGRVVTDKVGRYEIVYTPVGGGSTNCGPPADEINLVVRALDGTIAQPGAEITRSAIVSPARIEEEVDLTVDRAAGLSESLYTQIDRQFRRCLSQQASDLLQVFFGIRDLPGYLAFAAHATGLAPDVVLAYARANLIAGDINRAIPFGGPDPRYTEFGPFPAEVVFALTRPGLGDSLGGVLRVEPAQFLKALVDGMDQGLIDRVFEGRLPFGVTRSLSKQWSLIRAFFLSDTSPGNVVKTSESALLALALDDVKRQTFAARQSEFHGTFAAFVKALQQDETLTATEAENLNFLFDFFALAGRHLPIAQIVFARKVARGWKTVADLGTVTRRAENGVDGWTEFALLEPGQGGFPENIFGRSNEEKAAAHARRLFETFSQEFSQTRFVDGAARLGGGGNDPDLQAAVAFVNDNPTFDLVETQVPRFLEENNVELAPAVRQRLLQLQRLRRLTPDVAAAGALIDAGLDSAVAIARIDEHQFIADHELTLGGLDKAQTIHRRAKQFASEVLGMVIRFHEELNNSGGATALLGTLRVQAALQEAVSAEPRFARYAILFGNLFSCASRHCETVLSPAAYLVDLLQFAVGTPRDLLLERRPDITEIELNCENTDKVLPYIDLVIERLSAVVAPWRVRLTNVEAAQLDKAADPLDPGHDPEDLARILNLVRAGDPDPDADPSDPPIEAFRLTERARLRKLGPTEWVIEDDAVRWRIVASTVPTVPTVFVASGTPQTSQGADLLTVFPEHDSPLAERALGRAVFPLQLPLALGRREVELILRQRGLSRAEVLGAFPTELDPADPLPDPMALVADAAQARAFLSLTVEEEEALLSEERSINEYWGFEESDGSDSNSVPRPEAPQTIVTGSWPELMAEVSIFLHRAQLTYAQLLDLLATEFIHDLESPVVILADPDAARACNYNRFHLLNLSRAVLQRISFFLRLWRRLGWEMNTVDRYLLLLERTDGESGRNSPPDLVRLARLLQLAERLSLDPVDLFSFFAPLDLHRTERLGPSLFERALLKGPRSSVGFHLLEQVAAGESAQVTDQADLDSLQANLRTALGLKRADLLFLWQKVVPPQTFPFSPSVADLSALTRIATFTRALGLSVQDYYRSLPVLGIKPFEGADIDARLLSTADAVSQLTTLAKTGLSLKVVEYLLHYPGAEGQELLPTSDVIDEVRRSLAEAARAIEQRYPAVTGTDVARLSALLAEVMPAERIASVVSEVTKPTPIPSTPPPPPGTKPPGQDLLVRYLAVFLTDPAKTPDQIVNDLLTNTGYDEQARIELVASRLRTFLVQRERREQALTLAAETSGLARNTVDFLLGRALSSASFPSRRALSDWESSIGVLDLDVGAVSGTFLSNWVSPLDGQVRFVVVLPTPAADISTLTLTLDPPPPEPFKGTPVTQGTRTVVTFDPIDVRAGEVRKFELVLPPNTEASLAVRVNNGDQTPLPQGWFSGFGQPTYVKLQKAALLITGANLDAVELDQLFAEDQAAPADETLLDGLPTAAGQPDVPWLRLRAYLDRVALHRTIAMPDSSLFEVLSGTGTLTAADVAALTGWDQADVTAALDELWEKVTPPEPPPEPPSLRNADTWRVLYRAIITAARLDLRVAQVLELLVKNEPTSAAARTLREILRAKFTQQEFIAAFKGPRDQLRKAHRDALVGWLTTRFVDTGAVTRFFVNANDLLGFFLIDVQMEPDTEISRIKLALNSIQLFIDRVFLGLEDRSALNRLDQKKAQWKWMQNFRVWEANRKVFLYPENWIEPQLRDDKSELFKEMEDELLQDDVDDPRAQNVLASYVDKLKELSQLVIVGMHTAGAVYFVGRTRAKPYTYYYRTAGRSEIGRFSPWVKIPIEIDAAFVAPLATGKSLTVFWPLVVEKEKIASGGNDETKLEPVAVIRLLWSTLDGSTGKWSKPRLGQAKVVDKTAVAVLKRDPQDEGIDTSGYHLRPSSMGDGGMQVDVIKTLDLAKTKASSPSPQLLGTIVVNRQGEDFASQTERILGLDGFYPTGTILRNNAAHEAEGSSQIDQLNFAGNDYFARVPAPESFRMIVSDANYFSDPGLVPFLFEAGGTHVMGDLLKSYASPGLSRGQVREAQFETFDHPVMGQISQLFRDGGAEAIMNRLTQALPTSKTRSVYTYNPGGRSGYGTSYRQGYTYYGGVYLGYHIAGDSMALGITQRDFQLDFGPNALTVRRDYPLPTVEFTYGSPFGLYNWELFFHLPMLVADRLSQQLRFEEAFKWLHYVFDPRSDLNTYEQTKPWAQSLPIGARFWNFLPFFANRDVKDNLFDVFGVNRSTTNSRRDVELKRVIADWREHPFSPHLIARQRIAAYQKFTVMKYLDTLITWGDELYRRDTFETINQATQLYVLAAELLGNRPEVIEEVGKEPRASYRDLASRGIDDFSNALVELESLAVGSSILVSEESLPQPTAGLDFLSSAAFASLFFRIPRNEKLEGFWDTVADRLFKIRNSLNIDGVKRQLALFEPPIDPALLVRAQAAGIDLSSALSQLSRPLPHYRFSVWMGQAKELANELKSFSAALLSALEKKDAEQLAQIRQDHEVRLLSKVSEVRKAQLKDAQQNLAALQARRNLPVDRIQDLSNRKFISPTEASNMSLTQTAGTLDTVAGVMNTIGGALGAIPQIKVGFISAEAEYGGLHLNNIFQSLGAALGVASTVIRTEASLAGMLSGFERRQEDWNLQIRQAKLELKDIDTQIVGAEIRIDIAQKELNNHELQLEQSQEIQTFLKDKFTSRELFQWMIGQLSRTYQQVYRLAYDVAKTTERSFAFELGVDAVDFIQFEYRDNLRRGLLAGEKLYFDLKRMEVGYLEQNRREFEITKPISLESINPAAVQELREKGVCEFALPEILFDLDFPGQYFRRLRAVRLTIPAVTGPYTSVSAKLSLLSSAIRVKGTADPAAYAYQGLDDPRFVHDTRGIQSIAVSRAQDDAGVFELNFRDDRYLPFEGAGVVSRWRLELPEEAHQFDYSTISDVVMQVSYTARDAGGSIKEGAVKAIGTALNNLRQLVTEASAESGLVRVFSLKREFPDALHQLLTAGTTTLTLLQEHFPFLLRQLGFKLKPADNDGRIDVVVQTKGSVPAGVLKLTLNDGTAKSTNVSTTEAKFFRVSIERGTEALLVGGQEQWKVEQTGTGGTGTILSVNNVEDVIFVLGYLVEKAGSQ